MKTNLLRYTVLSLLLIVALTGCGPAYVGVRSGPAYGGYYGPRGYYGPGAYYAPRPRVYVAPSPRVYSNRPRYYSSPNYNNRYSAPRVYNGGRRGRY